MRFRQKLAVLAAAALPLAGFAAFGGVEAAGASTPLLTCTSTSGAVTFNNGGTGIFLNSNAGQSAELLADAYGGQTTITINKLAIAGQTFTLDDLGTPYTYTVLTDNTPGSGVETPDVLTFTPALPAATVTQKLGLEDKVKTAVTVNPTDGTNSTEAYATGVTEDLNVGVSSCTSSFGAIPGVFSPTQASISGTSSVTNAATGLEANPGPLSANVTWPTLSSEWTQPVATTVNFSVAKDDTLNLGDFVITYKGGVVAGDFATAKEGTLPLNALDAMTVCTEGEYFALQGSATMPAQYPATGSVTDPDSNLNGGPISSSDSPLVVCDGGTAEAYNSAPEGGGLGEILTAETGHGGSDNGADGTPILAIWNIDVDTAGNVVL